MEYGKIREMKGDTILSPSVPRLGVRISPDYIYLGNLQYLDCGSQQVEEFIYLCPNSIGHVTRLLLVRFQGFLENSTGIYEYLSPQKKQIDNQDFAYDIEYFDLQNYLNKSPRFRYCPRRRLHPPAFLHTGWRHGLSAFPANRQ